MWNIFLNFFFFCILSLDVGFGWLRSSKNQNARKEGRVFKITRSEPANGDGVVDRFDCFKFYRFTAARARSYSRYSHVSSAAGTGSRRDYSVVIIIRAIVSLRNHIQSRLNGSADASCCVINGDDVYSFLFFFLPMRFMINITIFQLTYKRIRVLLVKNRRNTRYASDVNDWQ